MRSAMAVDYGNLDGNGTYCQHSVENELRPLLIVFSSSGSVCAFMCFITITAIVLFRFFNRLTHRLILYMLLSILLFSLAVSVQFFGLWLKYWQGKRIGECIAESFLLQYSVWVMFLATLMMTLHLTSMVLLPTHYEKIAKLEPFYLLFPWIFPLLIAWIPFVHHNYGISGSWCWIRLYNENCSLNKEGIIEVYGIWYSELFVGLILNNIALVIIAVTLCKRACSSNEISMDYRKALKQTLPLLAYPMTYQFLSSFAIANRLYQAFHKGHDVQWMFYAHAVTAPSWGFFAPIFTLVYLIGLCKFNIKRLAVRSCCTCRKRKRVAVGINNPAEATARLLDPADHLTRYGVTDTCPTGIFFGTESEVDQKYEQTLSLSRS